MSFVVFVRVCGFNCVPSGSIFPTRIAAGMSRFAIAGNLNCAIPGFYRLGLSGSRNICGESYRTKSAGLAEKSWQLLAIAPSSPCCWRCNISELPYETRYTQTRLYHERCGSPCCQCPRTYSASSHCATLQPVALVGSQQSCLYKSPTIPPFLECSKVLHLRERFSIVSRVSKYTSFYASKSSMFFYALLGNA